MNASGTGSDPPGGSAPTLRGLDVARLVLAVLACTVVAAVLASLAIATPVLRSIPELSVPLLFAMEAAVIFVALYTALIRFGFAWADLGWVQVSGRWLAAGVAATAGVYVVSVTAELALQRFGGDRGTQWWAELLPLLPMSMPGFLLVLATGAVAVPIAEELLFRGVLYGWLRARWGAVRGGMLSAVVFALMHPPGGALQIFLVGLVLAWLYERSGSLWPSMVLHGCNNGVGFVLLYAAAWLDFA